MNRREDLWDVRPYVPPRKPLVTLTFLLPKAFFDFQTARDPITTVSNQWLLKEFASRLPSWEGPRNLENVRKAAATWHPFLETQAVMLEAVDEPVANELTSLAEKEGLTISRLIYGIMVEGSRLKVDLWMPGGKMRRSHHFPPNAVLGPWLGNPRGPKTKRLDPIAGPNPLETLITR